MHHGVRWSVSRRHPSALKKGEGEGEHQNEYSWSKLFENSIFVVVVLACVFRVSWCLPLVSRIGEKKEVFFSRPCWGCLYSWSINCSFHLSWSSVCSFLFFSFCPRSNSWFGQTLLHSSSLSLFCWLPDELVCLTVFFFSSIARVEQERTVYRGRCVRLLEHSFFTYFSFIIINNGEFFGWTF